MMLSRLLVGLIVCMGVIFAQDVVEFPLEQFPAFTVDPIEWNSLPPVESITRPPPNLSQQQSSTLQSSSWSVFSTTAPAEVMSVFDEAFHILSQPSSPFAGIATPITVEIRWTSLGANVLGSAGPTYIYYDSSGGVYVSKAQYKNIIDSEPSDQVADIIVNINSDFDRWWLDVTQDPPVGLYDMLTTVVHELMHGVGMTGLIRSGGSLVSLPYDFIYDDLLETSDSSVEFDDVKNDGDLLEDFTEGRNGPVKISPLAVVYTPSTFQSGSSVYHIDNDFADAIMNPTLRSGIRKIDMDIYTRSALHVLGWTYDRCTDLPFKSLCEASGQFLEIQQTCYWDIDYVCKSTLISSDYPEKASERAGAHLCVWGSPLPSPVTINGEILFDDVYEFSDYDILCFIEGYDDGDESIRDVDGFIKFIVNDGELVSLFRVLTSHRGSLSQPDVPENSVRWVDEWSVAQTLGATTNEIWVWHSKLRNIFVARWCENTSLVYQPSSGNIEFLALCDDLTGERLDDSYEDYPAHYSTLINISDEEWLELTDSRVCSERNASPIINHRGTMCVFTEEIL